MAKDSCMNTLIQANHQAQLLQGALNEAHFRALAAVPAELEWFANLDNPQTRRAYRADIREFQTFAGITAPTRSETLPVATF